MLQNENIKNIRYISKISNIFDIFENITIFSIPAAVCQCSYGECIDLQVCFQRRCAVTNSIYVPAAAAAAAGR